MSQSAENDALTVVHAAALCIGTNRVVCTCGEDFREHAYNGDAVAQFARHLRTTRVTAPEVSDR